MVRLPLYVLCVLALVANLTVPMRWVLIPACCQDETGRPSACCAGEEEGELSLQAPRPCCERTVKVLRTTPPSTQLSVSTQVFSPPNVNAIHPAPAWRFDYAEESYGARYALDTDPPGERDVLSINSRLNL